MKTSRLKLFRNGLTKLVAGVALALSLSGKVKATDYYVSTEGDDSRTEQEAQNPSTPWKTIQHAIDTTEGTVENPHTIHVAPGTYFENIIMNEYESLKGENRETTILDGNQNGSVVIGASNTTIEGFTIRDGSGTPVYTKPTNKPEFLLGVFGGGVHSWNLKDFIIQHDRVESNAAEYGGGISSCGSMITIRENTITNNHASACGGGVYILSGGSPTISNNRIVGNSSGDSGGGIQSAGFLLLTYNIIANNSAGRRGGGLVDYGDGSVTIFSNVIDSNSSGVYSLANTITPCVIKNTIITNNGYGIQFHFIYVCGEKRIGNLPIFSYNNVWNNSGGDYVGELEDQTGSNGNISADPLFVDPENYDYHLKPDSPCLAPNCALSYDQMGAYAQYFGFKSLRKINEEIEVVITGKSGYHVELYASDSPGNITSKRVKIFEDYTGLDGKLEFSIPIIPANLPKEFYQAVISK